MQSGMQMVCIMAAGGHLAAAPGPRGALGDVRWRFDRTFPGAASIRPGLSDQFQAAFDQAPGCSSCGEVEDRGGRAVIA
jgi:hypothetical protein